jgi:hypothetical protein
MTCLAFVALAAALCGMKSAALASVKHEETSSKTIETDGVSRFIFVGQRGDVSVVGEKGRSDIHLKVIKRVRAESKEEAEKFASLMDYEVIRGGTEIEIRTKYPKRTEIRKNIISYLLQRGPRMSMEFFIRIPDDLEADLNTASGDISVSDVAALVEINAASGDVEVVNVKSALIISVASGDIDAEKIGGKAKLVSASGDINASVFSKDVEVSTASGDVELSDISGDLTLQTVSGDATVDGVGSVVFAGTSGSGRFMDVRGAVKATASSGDLNFRVTPAADSDFSIKTSSGGIVLRFLKILPGGYVLRAGTTSGDIEANLPIRISKVGRHHIAGVVREGKSKVILETASGDITILEPEE